MEHLLTQAIMAQLTVMRGQLKSPKLQTRISLKLGSRAEKGYGNHKSEFVSLYPSPKKKCFGGNIIHAK